ncbi:MAG: GntR family transcriptional regulator [Planctomycetes bacterium]|nr:GntR family transcriptional regulator [Planctomycetota bacterium]
MIKAILQARLERESEPGAKLPPEVHLCRSFGVSRVTIQQALGQLEKEGLIRREQGRGTFYLGPRPGRTQTKLSELLQEVIRYREVAYSRVVNKGLVRATPRVAERLRLTPGAWVVALDRVGFVDDEPLVFIQGYVPHAIGATLLDADDYLRHNTVAEFLQERLGIVVESVIQTIAATLADPAFAFHLGVEVGAPVLEGERTYLDAGGTPLFFTVTFYRADRHRFVVSLKDWR